MKTRTALVTGATGGLGKTICEKLVRAGYTVCLHTFQHMEQAHKQVESMTDNGSSHLIVQADLSKEGDIQSMFGKIQENFGSLDVLICNAGVAASGLSWKTERQHWDEVFSVNTTGSWLCSKYAIPLLRQSSGGRILYVSSIVAHRPLVGTALYAASKSALEGLTRAQAVELARFNITVNCIAPGYFEAGMISSVDESLREDIRAHTPAGRLGHPDELAEMVVSLASPESGYITGQVLHVNGGLYI
ncbi:MAG: 3-oxoacyl-ACP reductase FabG [Sphingobacteriales bacterium]|jgi:3-oxoacyl-[acyl-carrier protein] reductase|nr:3-oxoacyl-ACP reductase FabG [Sphingobacteriales bacterium]